MTPADFSFDVRSTGESAVVALEGELDMAATFSLEPELDRLAGADAARTLVLDMGGVTFMDSSAIGLLLATDERLKAEGVRFFVADPSKAVRRVLEVTGAAESLTVTGPPERR